MNPDRELNPASIAAAEEVIKPSALLTQPTPQALLKAFQKRWKLAIPVALCVGLLASVVAWYLIPAQHYVVRTLLRIPPGSPYLFRTSEPVPQIQDHQRNQVAMVKSRLVLNNVLKDRRVANLGVLQDKPEPIQWLEQQLQADFSVAPEVMRIMMIGDDAGDLVTLVNVVREVYKTEVLDKERADRSERLTMLQQQHGKYETQLRARKEDERKFDQLAGGKDPGVRGMVLAFMQQQLNFFERELLSTQSELRRARTDLALRQANKNDLSNTPVPEAQIGDQVAKEPAVLTARATVQQLQTLLEETIKVAADGERSPKAIEIRKKIADAEQGITLLRKKLVPGITEELRIRNHHDAERTVQQLQSKIAFAEEDEKILNTITANLRTSINEKSENVGKADAAREDMAYLEDTTKRIAAEAAALEFELQAPDRYRMLEDAVATRPSDTKRGVTAVASVGAGAFVSVLLFFSLLEFRIRRLDGPDDVVYGLGLPLVGALPDTNAKWARATPGGAEQSFLDEADDTVRTMLLKAAQDMPLRVVLITSAHSGEGKTSLSTHLAASLAQVGYSTLLIDGDLRNPIAHKVFNLKRCPGFSDVLRSEISLDSTIQPTNVNRLFMISAGRWDGHATRVLAQDRTRQLMNELRSRFDFVIIDSSPVLPVVDPLLMGQHSDGAILSVLRDVSRMPSIFAAYQRLAAGGVHVLGAVMSGVRPDHYGAYYPYRPYGADAATQAG